MNPTLIFPIAIGLFFVALVVRRITQARAAKQQIAAGALVLDVRSKEEWNTGHLDGAHLFPVHELQSRLKEVERLAGEKQRSIVVYCRSGARSGQAKLILERAGYQMVVNGGAYAALAAR